MQYLWLALGLALVVKSADILIDSVSKIAKKFGVSTFVIGITVVAFGTSAPELAVGIISGVANNNQLTLGNIIGSGVANVAWIVGITAIIMPLAVRQSVIRREIPILLAVQAVLALMLFLNGLLSRLNGIILMLGFLGFMLYIVVGAKKAPAPQLQAPSSPSSPSIDNDQIVSVKKEHSFKLWIFAVLSLVGLFVGGRLTVDASSKIAQSYGLSETLIGLTVVAFATTLPELVASIMAVFKNEPDIILGNCIGSNIFNILLVLGASSTISPITVGDTLWIDMTVFFALTVFVFIVALTKKSLRRPVGIMLLLCYISYITYNIMAVTVF